VISFRVLGTLDLRHEHGEECSYALLRQKGVALLTYLALSAPRGFVRRDTLVGLLWPELDQTHARAALRKALHYLRRALGEGVLVSRGDEEVAVVPERFWSDASAFEDALREDESERALELYRGDLLVGFFLPACPEFENWLESERTRLREMAAGVAWKQASLLLQQGRITQAERLAQRAMELVCTDEVQVQRFIGALIGAGDRAAAFRFLERFAALLRGEFDLSPSRETMELARRLQEDPDPPAPSFGSRSTARVPEDAREASDDAETVGWDRTSAFDETPARLGRQRVVLTVLAGLALGAVVGITVTGNRTAKLTDSRIAVLPPVNRTGDASLDSYGTLAADWITEALDRAEFGRPVPFLELMFAADAMKATSDPRVALQERWPAETGADLAVAGSYYLLSDSLFFDLIIVDARGTVLEGVPPIGGPSTDVRSILDRLRFAVLSRLGRRLAPEGFQLMWPEGDPPQDLASAQVLYEAAHVYGTEGAAAAIPLFERAVELDSTYLAPQRWLLGAYMDTGRYAEADSVCGFLEDRIEGAPREARLATQMNCGAIHGDYLKALTKARELLEFSSIYYLRVGWHALDVNRPHEAVEVFSRYDPTASRVAASFAHSNDEGLALAYHWLGDHRREVKVAKEARRRLPENAPLIRREIAALIGLGRTEQALSVLQEGLALVPPGSSPGSFLDSAAREFDEHGNPPVAAELWERLVSWQERGAEPTGTHLDWTMERVDALLHLGRPSEAEAALRELADHQLQTLGARGRLGVALARLGRTGEANRISEELRLWDDPYDYGENTAWRAYIAASRGEGERAVSLLRDALAEGMTYSTLAPHDSPYLKPLRGQPAFEEFLRPKG